MEMPPRLRLRVKRGNRAREPCPERPGSRQRVGCLLRGTAGRYTTMTLATHEFIRRFLMHVLPRGLHRIRHYGLLAGGNLARMRELLGMAAPATEAGPAAEPATPETHTQLCPCCGGRMRIIEVFQPGTMPSARASPASAVIRIDTS